MIVSNKIFYQNEYLNFSKSNSLSSIIINIKHRLSYNKSLKSNNSFKYKLICLAKAIYKNNNYFFSKSNSVKQIKNKYKSFFHKIIILHVNVQVGVHYVGCDSVLEYKKEVTTK